MSQETQRWDRLFSGLLVGFLLTSAVLAVVILKGVFDDDDGSLIAQAGAPGSGISAPSAAGATGGEAGATGGEAGATGGEAGSTGGAVGTTGGEAGTTGGEAGTTGGEAGGGGAVTEDAAPAGADGVGTAPGVEVPDGKETQGVSDNSIRLGAPIMDTGAAPWYGVGNAAYWQSVNEQGGINGRMVEFSALSIDVSDSARQLAACRRLEESDRIFAEVGRVDAAGGCMDYYASTGTPQVDGFAHYSDFQSPYSFPIGVPVQAACKNGANWAYDQFEAKVWAAFWVNHFLSTNCKEGGVVGLKGRGASVAYESFQPFGYPDYSADVSRAQSAGADAILCSCVPGTLARVQQATARQGWAPPVMSTWHGYGTIIAETVGDTASDKVFFADKGVPGYDQTNNPQVQAMQDAVGRFEGRGAIIDASTPYAWFASRTAHLALEAIGTDVTRSRFMGWLANQSALDIGTGMLPLDFRQVTNFPGYFRIPQRGGNITGIGAGGAWINVSEPYEGIGGNNPDIGFFG